MVGTVSVTVTVVSTMPDVGTVGVARVSQNGPKCVGVTIVHSSTVTVSPTAKPSACNATGWEPARFPSGVTVTAIGGRSGGVASKVTGADPTSPSKLLTRTVHEPDAQS